ncbi:MAG: hypothetical protein O3A00_08250 [Planctomycetota bacterium]|nr:hypothetical protein [Planctomycetota bacterium]
MTLTLQWTPCQADPTENTGIDPKTTYHREVTLEVWANRLQHENNIIRWITAAKLDGEGPSPPYLIPHLLDLTSDRDPRVARHAIGALGQLGEYSEIIGPVLKPIAGTSLNPNQKHAIAALGKLAYRSTRPDPAYLRKLLTSADVTSRSLAARGLWSLEGKPEYLEVILEDTCRLQKCRRRGVVLSLAHFAAAEPSFVPACERFVKQKRSGGNEQFEQQLVDEIKQRAKPLIAARKARSNQN